VEIALQSVVFIAGLAVALVASAKAVSYARALAAAVGLPSFVVGVTLVSIGTDLPEIANSISAHLQGEGDVNVGDSVGSVLTQSTFVLGLFPFVVAGAIAFARRQVALPCLLTAVGLALTLAFAADGWLARWEGFVLCVAWALSTWIVVRSLPGLQFEPPPDVRIQRRGAQLGIVLLALAVVGVGATFAVRALVRLAELVGVPEFLLAFFGASLGTSAPEIVVDITALLRGAPGIALGDALGSSLVDSTLSIGIGAAVQPAGVTPRLAIVGSAYALLAVSGAGTLLAVRLRHDRASGVILLSMYAFAYVVLLSIGE
jgi:cation:H+ antiporter